MKNKKLFLSILTFFVLCLIKAFILTVPANAYLTAEFGSNNSSGVIWEVGFRLEASGLTPVTLRRYADRSNPTYYLGTGNNWVTYNRGTTYQWREAPSGCNIPGDPPWNVRWSTACVDPLVSTQGFSSGALDTAGCYQDEFRPNDVTRQGGHMTTGPINITASGNIPSGTYNFLGWGNTSNCPTACPAPDCTGRCGTITNSCGKSIDCGGCGGTFCGSGATICDRRENFCNSNNVCDVRTINTNAAICGGVNGACFNDGQCGGNQYCQGASPCGVCTAYAQIAGRVYTDENRNGVWDGEPPDNGPAGRTVQRKLVSDANWAASTTTGGAGRYTFSQLNNPSSHDVRIIDAEYSACTYSIASANPRFNIAANANQDNIDFRVVRNHYAIRGTVYRDTNENGVLDGADERFINRPGVEVRVVGEGRFDTLNPDNGVFNIGGNPEGNYTISLVGSSLPSGFAIVGSSDINLTINCGASTGHTFLVTRSQSVGGGPGPDLTVSSFNFPDGNPGTTVNVDVTIRNIGSSGTGGPFVVRLRNGGGNGRSVNTNGLAAGASRVVSFTIPMPPTDGYYTAYATADWTNVIAESNEGNNEDLDNYRVGSPPGGNPEGWEDDNPAACSTIGGWACDRDDYSAPLQVQIWVDGPQGWGTYLTTVTANNYRPDLPPAGVCGGDPFHGFSIPYPDSFKDGNTRQIYTYAVNIGQGLDVPLNSTPHWFTCSPPVPTFTISGGLYEEEEPSDNIRNGEGYTTSLTESFQFVGPGINTSAFSSAGSGFAFTNLLAGVYTITLNNLRPDYLISYPNVGVVTPSMTLTIGDGLAGRPLCSNFDAASNVGICDGAGNMSLVDFGIIANPPDPWYKGIGGDIRSDQAIVNVIPAGNYFSEAAGNLSPGVVIAGGPIDLGGGGSQASKANVNQWLITGVRFSPFRPNTIRTSYNFVDINVTKSGTVKNPMSGSAAAPCGTNPLTNCVLTPAPASGVYQGTGDLTISAGPTYTFPAGSDYIFLIQGDVRIGRNLVIPTSSTVMFIVQGDITVDPAVTRLDGIYSSDDDFILETNTLGNPDAVLQVQGNIITNAALSNGSFIIRRDLGRPNATTPVVTFLYRPDFILNAPEVFRAANITIKEVEPPGLVYVSPTPAPTITPNPTVCPPASNNAFTGCYYDNRDFTNYKGSRIDPAINFDWGESAPHPAVGPEEFSVRWTGNFNFNTTGIYRFTFTVDDGIRMYIDDVLQFESWGPQPPTTYTKDVSLSAGTHRIRVEYWEQFIHAVAKVSW